MSELDPNDPPSPFTWTHIRLLLLFVCAVGLLFSVGINFTPSAATIDLRSLDRHENLSYRQFDIVLSYYKEDLSFVARFIRYLRNVSTIEHRHPRVIVYNKNPQMNSSHLRQTLLADLVIPLPNFGREGATYLTHIINNYHTLADHTLFSQAGVEGVTETGLSPWFSDRLIRQFNSTVGYMPMVDGSWISTYDCGHHPSAGHYSILTELWALVEHSLCPPGGQAVSFRGQFLVSRKRIHSRPYEIYKYLNDLITANNSHWIHRDRVSPNSMSTQDNPLFGHMIERFWTVLLNCSQPDLNEKCRRGQCFCLD